MTPAFAGRGSVPTFPWRQAGFGPAATVGGDLLEHRLAQAVPRMPPVTDLPGTWSALRDGLGVSGRAVPAHDTDAGMSAQPRRCRAHATVSQHVDRATGDPVDHHGGVP